MRAHGARYWALVSCQWCDCNGSALWARGRYLFGLCDGYSAFLGSMFLNSLNRSLSVVKIVVVSLPSVLS